MSNAGKSYRSRILRDGADFLWYQVDEEIQKALGFADMADISSWLGYPTSPTYPEREREYLVLENTYTKEASMSTHGKNLVFDTTGSVVHLDSDTLAVLDANTLVINLDVGEDSLVKMQEKFFAEPKPVVWDGFLDAQPGESEEEAIRRAFPALLRERRARYQSLAHMTIPADELYDASAADTLAIIRSRL